MAKKSTLGEIEGFKDVANEIRKAKIGKAELVEKVINRQLSPFYRTVETLKDKEVFELKVTPEDQDKWIESGARFIQKNSSESIHRDRKEAEKEMCWINHCYGLGIKGGWDAQKSYLIKQGINVL